jgi:dihydrofolate reductase
MRKLILGVAVTLDGFIEGPNGEYDWCFSDQDYGMENFMKSIDAIFYGRKSYDVVLKEESKTGVKMFTSIKSYVFSNTWKEVSGATLISGDIRSKVDMIKKEPGGNIWLFGGAALTSVLMNEGLVDELWLSVHPILLGNGTPLFRDIKHRVVLELLDSKTYSSGLVSVRYQINNH